MNKTKKAIIFGTGSFAEVAYYFLTNDEYEVAAFTISKEKIANSKLLNLPIFAFEDIEKNFSQMNSTCLLQLVIKI